MDDSGEVEPLGLGPLRPAGGRPTKKGHDAEHIRVRRELVEQLELRGASERQIAEATHVSRATVRDDLTVVRRARRDALMGIGFDVEAERALEWARLEQQRSRLDKLAQQGSLGAHRVLVRISESKRKLLGLDAPTVVEVHVDPYEAIATGVPLPALAALALRQPGDIIDIDPDDVEEVDPDDA